MENNDDPNIGRWVDDRLASLHADATPHDAGKGWALLEQQRGAATARGRRWAWTLSAAAAMCTGLLAFPVTRAFAGRCVDACMESFSLRSTPSRTQLHADRKTAPDFTLQDATGKAVKLSDFRGQVVLLNFWATWCGPCKVEIPWFMEFERKYKQGNFAVLGVSFDEDGWASVKPYMDAKNVNYRVMLGNDDLDKLYGGIGSLPTTLLIDRNGRIAVTHQGLCPQSDYESEIEALLAEK